MTELELGAKKMHQEKRLEEGRQDLQRRGQNVQLAGDALGLIGKAVPGIKFSGHLGKGGKSSSKNHPEWYNRNKDLVRDGASLSYATPLGSPNNTIYTNNHYISGIMRLNFVPVLPSDMSSNGELVTPEILQSFKSQYAAIRKANSGARNYEYLDLARYQLAIQSAINVLADARRAYAVSKQFDAQNRFIGHAYSEALGWNMDNIRQYASNFRGLINYYQKVLKSYALPAINPIVSRQVWLNSNIFKDTPNKRSRHYVFVMKGYYILHTPTSDTDNRLLDYGTLPDNRTVSMFKSVMDDIMNALLNDPYSAIISGDIMKAYGEVTAVEFDSLDIDYTIEPAYEPAVLNQINSAVIIGNQTIESNPFVVFQTTLDGAPVLSQVTTGTRLPSSGDAGVNTPYMLNLHNDSPTPDDNMVASRFGTVMTTTASEDLYALIPGTRGTEVITDASIIYFNKADNKFDVINNIFTFNIGEVGDNTVTDYTAIAAISQFDWHPLYTVTLANNVYSQTIPDFIHNLDNFCPLDINTISRLHVIAATSLYNLLSM